MAGYLDNDEEWVLGYGGLLNIRPKYQREFVYEMKQQQEVIYSICKNFPLNVMYWIKNNDGTFELLDGQQRTLSICRFVEGKIYIVEDGQIRYFEGGLTSEERENFLDYELTIYFCEWWSEREILDWFRIINVAWEKLTDQELLNAVYTWPWLTDAKKYFSKTKCVAYQKWEKYIKWSPIRQEYLEKVLKWISNDNITDYMAQHQKDANASELWQYFQNVINWVENIFPKYFSDMKWIEWGFLYNNYKNNNYNAVEMTEKVEKLRLDDDITKYSGIYEYLLGGNEKLLSIRSFTLSQKIQKYSEQNGICANKKDCIYNGKKLEISEMEADHITPWHLWWKTILENCQMLCKNCNRKKSGK